MSDLSWDQKVRKQVEFYFSESNYPRDKFLRALSATHEEGYVPLSKITLFKRMKELEAVDVAKVAEALRSSTALQISEDGTLVKRKEPVSQESLTKSIEKTVHMKCWPQPITIEEVEEALKSHGTVVCVRIRKKKKDRVATGKLFVEFETVEQAKALADMKTFKYKDQDILILPKADWYLKSKLRRKQKKKNAAENGDNNNTGVSDKKRKAEDSEELPEKKIKIENGKEEEREGKQDVMQEDMQEIKKEIKQEIKKETKEPMKKTMVKGVIIAIKGIEKGVTRETVKNIFSNFGVVPKYIELLKDATDAFVRMDTPEDTQKAVTSMTEAKVAFGKEIPRLVVLDGVEEEEYWKKIQINSQKGKKLMKTKFKRKQKKRN